MNAVKAFIFNGSGDWKISVADDWDFDVVELEGNEKVVGHHKIDGSICKVLQSDNGKLIAISK